MRWKSIKKKNKIQLKNSAMDQMDDVGFHWMLTTFNWRMN